VGSCKIAFLGDLMCGDSFYAIGSGVASKLDKYGTRFLSDDIVKCLSGHDIVCCNIESVLSDAGKRANSLRSLHMRGKPQIAKYLADWGINLASVANNHILEQGYEAAIDTVNNLQQAGINIVGAGKGDLFSKGLEYENINISGQDIVFLNLCLLEENYSFNGGLKLEEAINNIIELKSKGKAVIISLHWGNELMDKPDTEQKLAARQLIEAGALLVIGHHPHVVQGIEKVNESLIAYSLGNFIFDSFWEDSSWTIILSVTLRDNTLIDWQFVPVEKDGDHRPRLAQGYRKEELHKEFIRRCELASSNISDGQYRKEYEILRQRARKQLRIELLKNAMTISGIFWPQILYRFIQRRIGKW
jgi:gamma-polyglutamate biosynthesis protein CapA